MTQRRLRPSAELVAAMRAHDDSKPKTKQIGTWNGVPVVEVDGGVTMHGNATVVYAESDGVVHVDRRAEFPEAVPQTQQPRRWSVEAVRWMVVVAAGSSGHNEWGAVGRNDERLIRNACHAMRLDDLSFWCRAELARLPRWSEREIAYLRAAQSDTAGMMEWLALSADEQRRMHEAAPVGGHVAFRQEAARLVAIHDVLSVVG